VRANAPNSHADKGWEAFVREVVKAVDRWGGASLGSTGVGEGVVFMAWGANAQDRVKGLNKVRPLFFSFFILLSPFIHHN
jgi:uracil-DNA glycosylase